MEFAVLCITGICLPGQGWYLSRGVSTTSMAGVLQVEQRDLGAAAHDGVTGHVHSACPSRVSGARWTPTMFPVQVALPVGRLFGWLTPAVAANSVVSSWKTPATCRCSHSPRTCQVNSPRGSAYASSPSTRAVQMNDRSSRHSQTSHPHASVVEIEDRVRKHDHVDFLGGIGPWIVRRLAGIGVVDHIAGIGLADRVAGIGFACRAIRATAAARGQGTRRRSEALCRG